MLGVTVSEKTQAVEKFIREISIPKECVVAAVIRGKKFVVPRGDTKIYTGDRVIFVGPPVIIEKAQNVFIQKK